MMRRTVRPRPDWRRSAEKLGFRYADLDGVQYWDESVRFEFTLRQIEDDIEAPTAELHQMCLDLADRAARDETLLTRLGAPRERYDDIAASWSARETNRSLYGRFDLAYDGRGPAKLLEYNADTPTGLFETAVFQWTWLEECRAGGLIDDDADQFNSVHEALVTRLTSFPSADALFHFAGYIDDPEDGGTIDYLADCALQAGHEVRRLHVDRIGVDAQGRFTDEDDIVIFRLFKLHPWEWIFDGEYASTLSRSGCQFVEPMWKAMLSTKALLPLLWELHPGHPNLLPAFFEGDPAAAGLKNYVRKPLFSREGANVTLVGGGETVSLDGPYGAEGHVIQQAGPVFRSEGGFAVIGSWIVGDAACGIGIREDASPITMNRSRFAPHAIVG